MNSFTHTISYKQEEQDLKDNFDIIVEEEDFPETIEVLPLLFEKNSVTFVVNQDIFEEWCWSLPMGNEELIIETFVKNNPKTQGFDFKFILTQSPNYFMLD
mgnify:CR=1 FL=1